MMDLLISAGKDREIFEFSQKENLHRSLVLVVLGKAIHNWKHIYNT